VPLGDFLFMWAFFPWTTFVLAIYTGNLSGLLLTSCLLFVYSIAAAKRHKGSGSSPLPPTTEEPD